jgi:hypothetical protein
MKHQNIFWGVILILIGTLVLFDRLGFFIFEWAMVRQLWPVLLILWGISILPTKGFIKLILAFTVAGISVVIYQQRAPEMRTEWKRFDFKRESQVRDRDQITQYFSEPYDETITRAKLTLDAGAGAFKLKSSDDNLVGFNKERSTMRYDFRVESYNEEATVKISQNSNIHLGKNNRNDVEILLHSGPVWSTQFNIGAGSFDFDFSGLMVDEIKLDGGAASIEFKLGDLLDKTMIDINTAASSITLYLPKNAGAILKSNAVISSRNIEGFERMSRGLYQTENYDEAVQKIDISMDAAVSSFTVKWY